MTRFGPLRPIRLLEQAVIDTLQTWELSYRSEAGRQLRGGSIQVLQQIRSWRRVTAFPTDPPDEQLPYVAVVSAGTVGPAVKDTSLVLEGEEAYRIPVGLAVGVLCGAGGARAEEDARDLADDYGWFLAAATVQKLSKTSVLPVMGVTWQGVTYADGPQADRTLASAVHSFHVDVLDVLSDIAGPLAPDVPVDPPGDYPIVQTFAAGVEPDPDPRHS